MIKCLFCKKKLETENYYKGMLYDLYAHIDCIEKDVFKKESEQINRHWIKVIKGREVTDD